MSFQIHSLDPAPFAPLFDLSDGELAAKRARRVTAERPDAYPCRVSLTDAALGDTLILANFTHMDIASPYYASHAVYIRSGAERAMLEPGEVPEMLSRRLLSLRGFDRDGLIQAADLLQGEKLANRLADILADPAIEFVDMHIARPGCFAARATRA
ncbi:MAG: DUF1203 domain-containing protein [Pseudomonadota bacterium]